MSESWESSSSTEDSDGEMAWDNQRPRDVTFAPREAPSFNNTTFANGAENRTFYHHNVTFGPSANETFAEDSWNNRTFAPQPQEQYNPPPQINAFEGTTYYTSSQQGQGFDSQTMVLPDGTRIVRSLANGGYHLSIPGQESNNPATVVPMEETNHDALTPLMDMICNASIPVAAKIGALSAMDAILAEGSQLESKLIRRSDFNASMNQLLCDFLKNPGEPLKIVLSILKRITSSAGSQETGILKTTYKTSMDTLKTYYTTLLKAELIISKL